MYNIKTLRGTIFCPPIKYSRDFVSSLSDLTEGYTPVLIRDNGAQPLPVWQLLSPDEKEVIQFNNGDKIDLVQVVENNENDARIHEFSERCKMVFEKILVIKESPCTRIALAPSIIITEKGVSSVSLYKRVFAIRDFQGANLESGNLSQVYRVNQYFDTREIKINHVVNFHAESELVPISGVNQIRERYIGDFDINTMVNPEYKFSIDNVKTFFDFATTNFIAFYNLYFPE